MLNLGLNWESVQLPDSLVQTSFTLLVLTQRVCSLLHEGSRLNNYAEGFVSQTGAAGVLK